MMRRAPILPLLVAATALIAIVVSTALARPATQVSLQTELQRIEERSAQMRELVPTGPIKRETLQRGQVRAFLESRILQDNSPAEIEANQVRWEVLGYVPT